MNSLPPDVFCTFLCKPSKILKILQNSPANVNVNVTVSVNVNVNVIVDVSVRRFGAIIAQKKSFVE
jgi:hypothetical protein